jgi:hypothetical protein
MSTPRRIPGPAGQEWRYSGAVEADTQPIHPQQAFEEGFTNVRRAIPARYMSEAVDRGRGRDSAVHWNWTGRTEQRMMENVCERTCTKQLMQSQYFSWKIGVKHALVHSVSDVLQGKCDMRVHKVCVDR